MQLIETMLGRLGSRFTLHFLPREKQVRLSPLGKYYDLPWHLRLGFRVGEVTRVLPFVDTETEIFPEVEMELTMTSVTFRARDRQLGLAASIKFSAPFYPKDEALCLAPFFYLDVTLESAPGDKPVELIAGLELAEGTNRLSNFGAFDAFGAILQANYQQIKQHWGPYPAPDSLSDKTYQAPLLFALYQWPEASKPSRNNDAGFKVTANCRAGDSFRLLLASHMNEPVLEVKQQPYIFRYNRYFPDLAAVYHFAIQNEQENKGKSAQFDQLVLDSSLGKSKTDFIAFTFQSYIQNTWWADPQTPSSNTEDWFSVWEGNCVFHSTVDVEYNLAWIYLLLWPELLEKTIAEWRGYFQKDERGEWLSHDVGGLLGANRQTYPHQMEVEESCNFVLLVYALWSFTGWERVRTDNQDAVARLIRFVLDSDTTGNGFPDRGTANTVDDASPAVQFGREQTYLAVKALAACWASTLLLDNSSLIPHPASLIEECRQRVAVINRTLDERAWLGDHFAVTLDRKTDGLINPWSGQPLPPGELTGWDAYSIYTANGLLYLLATDTQNGANLPPGDYSRYRRDIVETVPRALIEYGCTHSSQDKSHIWVSQNLHRDFVAAYLGEDLSDLTDRYWAFEQFENSQGRGGTFVDTYGGNHLRYYPRGITSLGLLYALAGVRLDRVAGRLQVRPVRAPLRVPLLSLADWTTGRVPWLHFRLQNGKINLEIENEDLLEGLTVISD
jgi:hypothetical protein